jgi:hypothetical protein
LALTFSLSEAFTAQNPLYVPVGRESSMWPHTTTLGPQSMESLKLGMSTKDDGETPLVGTVKSVYRKKKLKTFMRYLEVECWKRQELRSLEPVLQAVGESCKQINLMVQRAQTDDLYGAALGPDGLPLDENVQGEVQQKLDVVCNTIMLRTFCGCSNSIARVASEEEDVPRCCSDVMVRIYMLFHLHLQQKKRTEKGIIFSINSTLTFLFLLRLV